MAEIFIAPKKKHVFALVIAAIIGFAVFGDKGLIDVYRLKKEIGGILSYNKGFEKENRTSPRP